MLPHRQRISCICPEDYSTSSFPDTAKLIGHLYVWSLEDRMRYELNGGPLDGTRGEVPDDFQGNLAFPAAIPTAEGHDPTSDRRSELRYRKTALVKEDGVHVYVYDSVQHRNR
jgi:hypothetical protein